MCVCVCSSVCVYVQVCVCLVGCPLVNLGVVVRVICCISGIYTYMCVLLWTKIGSNIN